MLLYTTEAASILASSALPEGGESPTMFVFFRVTVVAVTTEMKIKNNLIIFLFS